MPVSWFHRIRSNCHGWKIDYTRHMMAHMAHVLFVGQRGGALVWRVTSMQTLEQVLVGVVGRLQVGRVVHVEAQPEAAQVAVSALVSWPLVWLAVEEHCIFSCSFV